MTDHQDADTQVAIIHLLGDKPPEGAAVCTCINPECGIAFNPKSQESGWTVSRREHAEGRYKGKYRSCATKAP